MGTVTDEYSPELLDLLAAAAKETRDWYSDYTTGDDLYGEMATYTAANRRRFQKWIDDDQPFRVTLALKSVARIHGETEKARALGYEFEDVGFYSPAGLAKLIPLALDPGWDGLSGEADESGIATRRPPSEGGNLLCAVLDVRRILTPPLGHGKWMVTDFEIGSDAGMERLVWLSDRLGGEYPSAPGYGRGRRAVSNEQARRAVAA